jgi:hypothetical protein
MVNYPLAILLQCARLSCIRVIVMIVIEIIGSVADRLRKNDSRVSGANAVRCWMILCTTIFRLTYHRYTSFSLVRSFSSFRLVQLIPTQAEPSSTLHVGP